MIFALIFLSVSLVLSHQQRYPAPTTTDLMYWLPHYYLPSRQAFNHYNYNYHHPVNGEAHPGYYHPFLRHFTLAKPNSQTFSQQVKMETQEPYANYHAIESANGLDDENEFPDYQPRFKGFNRIRPLFQPKKPQNDPRFVINLASPNNLFNKKVKTITFTLTSSLTFTSVKSCIPSEQFFNGSADVSCRRKRREIVEVDQGIESDELTQFAIIPSDVQPLESTRLSSSLDLRMKEDYGQRTDDRTFNRQQIISSKDEDEVTSFPASYSRVKRLFFHFVTTTTVINYSFTSTTVTKTVSLLNTLAFPGAYLICRPDGYTVCPYTANNNNNNNNNNNDPLRLYCRYFNRIQHQTGLYSNCDEGTINSRIAAIKIKI